MAIIALPAPHEFLIPRAHHGTPWDGFANQSTLDANGEKTGFRGYVWNKDHADGKQISKVAFRMGDITKSGSTDIQVSLQDIDLATGFPDETADQTGLVGNANLVDNTWVVVTLGSNRTVNFGELLGIVWEFSTFNAGDIFRVSLLWNIGIQIGFPGGVEKIGGSWSVLSVSYAPNVALGFSDNTWGCLFIRPPISDANLQNINSGSTPDEIALRFQVTAPLQIDGLYSLGLVGSTSCDWDYVLYQDTTQLAKVSVDGHVFASSYAVYKHGLFDEGPQPLSPGNTYYAAIKPTTGNNYSLPYEDVPSNDYFGAHPLGIQCYWAQRTDGGAWSTTTTRRPFIFLHPCGFDDGAGGGGGGGLLRHPGMSGGLNA